MEDKALRYLQLAKDIYESQGDKKVLQCSGCGATFKHAPSLSTHKNGNVKKGLRPCKKYYESIGKEYEERINTRAITDKEYEHLMTTFKHVMDWIQHEKDTSPPPVQLKPFGKHYPPHHVSLEWMKTRFMKQRYGDFVATMFSGFHVNTTDGREYCNIRIPKASHSNDVEIYDGEYWRMSKLYNIVYQFINKTLIPLMEEIDNDDDESYTDRLMRFINRWSPDEEEELKRGYKEDIDDDNQKHTYRYEEMIHKIKAPLLGEKREEINLIKKHSISIKIKN